MTLDTDPAEEARRSVLRTRGVPEKFVIQIAEMRVPRLPGQAIFDPPIAAVAAAFAIGAFAVMMGVLAEDKVVKSIFASQIQASDLFIPGPNFTFGLAWGAIMLFLTPVGIWLLIAITRNIALAETDDYQQKNLVTAFWLANDGKSGRNPIPSDLRFSNLADAPSVDAFLVDAAKAAAIPFEGRGRTPVAKRRAKGVYITVAVMLVITSGVFTNFARSFVNIHGDELEYESLATHFTIPLSQVTSVRARCEYVSRTRGGTPSPTLMYFLDFRNHHIDLLDVGDPLKNRHWTNNLDELARIDHYLNASNVRMDKFRPFDQLSERDQNCLAAFRLNHGGGDARVHQLIFSRS